MLSTQAQDVPTAEPVPLATEIVSAPPSEPPATEEPIVVLPTEAVVIPTDVISPPVEETTVPTPEVTSVPTQEIEIVPVPTEEVIAAPTEEATAVPTSEATAEASVPVDTDLPLAFSANFDTVPAVELSEQTGWLEVAVDGGKALQADLGAVMVVYTAATFTDAAVEARFLLNTGEGLVMLRGYTAGLKADGTVTLYRDQVEMVSSVSPTADSPWILLRLQIVGTKIQVSVNGVLVIDSEDAMLLPEGLAGFTASSAAVLRVDDFAVYGTGTAIVKPPSEEGEGEASPTVGEPLVAPTGVVLSTNANNDVILDWNDTNDDEERYEIQRYVNAPLTPHATVGYAPGVLGYVTPGTFTENAIGCGLTVWYRVRATRGVDVGPWSSWKAVSTAPCAPAVCTPGAAIKRVNVGEFSTYQSASIHIATGRSLSEDGRSILFSSSNPLVGDPQVEIDAEAEIGANDSYIYNTTDCSTYKISIGDGNATPANGETTEGAYPSAILNGPAGVARAIFYSASSDLTDTTLITDIDGFKDVFWRDHFGSMTELVSMEDGGTVSLDAGDVLGINATIDGDYILMSMADPVPGADNNDEADLLLYNNYNDILNIVTLNAAGDETADDASFGGEVLVDPDTGEIYVVFSSFADNLVGSGANVNCTLYMPMASQCAEVFVRNIDSGITTRISAADNEVPTNGSAIFDDAVIYKGKLYVTFQSVASNLVSGVNANNGMKAYLRTVPLNNVGVGTTLMYARASNAAASPVPTGANASGPSYGGKLSSDARWIAFTSAATNLVAGDINGKTDVFVRDLMTSMTSRVSPTMANTQDSFATDISADGTTVLFYSATSDLVPGDTANVCEVDFVDSQPDAGEQYDYNENCPDLFVVANPLWVALAPPTALTASVNLFEQIHITWTAAVGADSYDIEISNNNFNWSTAGNIGPVTSFDLDYLYCNEAWYIRVRSRAGEGRVSAFTTSVLGRSAACSAPFGIFPANNALLTDGMVEVEWGVTTFSDLYEVDLSTVATFATHVIGYPKTTLTPDQYIPLDGDPIFPGEQPLPDGVYYWRVRGKFPGEGPYSVARSFTVDTVPPAPPAFTAPANHSIVRNWRPTFTWVATAGVRYEVELSYTGGSTLFTQPATTPYTPPAFPQGNYTAVLNALDAAGNVSSSTPLNYTVNPALTPAPNAVISPVGLAVSANVKFTWAAAPAPLTAPVYTVEVDDNPLFDDDDDPSTPYVGIDYTCVGTALPAPTCTINSIAAGTYYWRVVRAGESELIIGTSPSNKFTVGFAAPRAPRLLTPTNGKYLTPTERMFGNVIFTWDWGAAPAVPPAGANFFYQIEVSTSSLFDIEPLYIIDTLTPNAQTAGTDSLLDGLYYWRVRAVNTSGVWGAWSAGFNFVVDSAPPDNAPNLLTPTPGSTVSTARPTFTWAPVTGAYRYEVKVVETADCATGNLIHASTGLITTTSYTVPPTVAALAQGLQYVCVKAFDLSENNTAFSAPVAFAIFLGTGPANGAFIPSVPATSRPTFTWMASPGVAPQVITYKVQVDTNTDFVGLHYESVAVATATHAMPPGQLLPVGTYYWRVARFINGTLQGFVGSPVYRKFYVGALTAGPALTAIDPIIANDTNLQWTAATPPAGTNISHYEIVLSKSATFAPLFGTPQIILATDPLESMFIIPDLNQNRVTYYWRVRGLDNGLPVTNWSMSSFIVDNVASLSPTITAPLTGTIVSTVRPPITWLAAAGAVNYRVKIYDYAISDYIDLDPAAGVATEVVVNAPLLTYLPVVNLPQSTIRVEVTTFDGFNVSSPESIRTFVVRLGTAPAHNGVVTVVRPMFSWTLVPNAASYELQIDDDPTFDQGTPDSTIFRTVSNIPTASHTLAAALPALANGVYYWRVKPSNGDYPTNFGSKMFTLNTNSKPLNPVLLNQTDTLININEDSPITMSWTAPALTPITYIVQVSTMSSFQVITDFYPTNATFVNAPEGSMNEGVNYWRVKAVYSNDETNSVYSDVKSFTLDTQAPPAPSSTFAMDSVVNTLRPTLTAGLSATATKYHFTLYEVTGIDPAFIYTPITRFNDKVVLKPATGAVVNYVMPTTLQSLDQGILYAWGVEAEDAAGNISASFIKRHFTVFVGKTPANKEFLIDTTPAFTWTALAGTGAATWKLQIARDPFMSPASIAHETTVPLAATAASYTLPNSAALLPGLYYWRVIRTTGADAALITGQPFYVVTSLASITPAPLLPLTTEVFNAEEVTAGMDFLWTDLWQINSPFMTIDYEVEIRKGLPTNLVYETVPACGCAQAYWLPLTTPPDDIYHWRVRAVFDGLYPGPFGAWRTFRIDTTLPGAPALSQPVDTAIITNTRTPLFKWTAAAGTPTRYVLEVSDTDDFNTIRYTAIVLTPTLMHMLPPSESLPNGTYYWRVTARDAAGNPVELLDIGTPATSLERSFTIAIP